jgi:hypothetical protein
MELRILQRNETVTTKQKTDYRTPMAWGAHKTLSRIEAQRFVDSQAREYGIDTQPVIDTEDWPVRRGCQIVLRKTWINPLDGEEFGFQAY